MVELRPTHLRTNFYETAAFLPKIQIVENLELSQFRGVCLIATKFCPPSALPVAHRYAIFLCSWDVEIDDSLVGQLTALPVAHCCNAWISPNT